MQGVPDKAQLTDFIGKLVWTKSNLPHVAQDPAVAWQGGQAAPGDVLRNL